MNFICVISTGKSIYVKFSLNEKKENQNFYYKEKLKIKFKKKSFYEINIFFSVAFTSFLFVFFS